MKEKPPILGLVRGDVGLATEQMLASRRAALLAALPTFKPETRSALRNDLTRMEGRLDSVRRANATAAFHLAAQRAGVKS